MRFLIVRNARAFLRSQNHGRSFLLDWKDEFHELAGKYGLLYEKRLTKRLYQFDESLGDILLLTTFMVPRAMERFQSVRKGEAEESPRHTR
ncbi:hypothetical protein [Mesotoga sp.]|uniref:hypothetical protein n=1 Tax=Mesotoga sp. TaxID=2053577 RepID=UPI00345E743A